jgi:hypothetical protein
VGLVFVVFGKGQKNTNSKFLSVKNAGSWICGFVDLSSVQNPQNPGFCPLRKEFINGVKFWRLTFRVFAFDTFDAFAKFTNVANVGVGLFKNRRMLPIKYR